MRIIDSLSFTGGGLIVVIFFTPFLLRIKGWLSCAAGIIGISIISYSLNVDKIANWGISIQQAVFIMTACIIFSVSVSDYIKNRDGKSLLLVLWVLGTFVFASMVNWTVSERVILPMAPAVGILISRRLAWRTQQCGKLDCAKYAFAIVPALFLSLLVTLADYRWSSEMHASVQRLSLFSSNARQHLWFQGHWGFQYYMEQIGGTPLDFNASKVQTGDLFVTPPFGSCLDNMPNDILTFAGELPTNPLSWLTVMNLSNGAGFYSNVFGHLPYVFDYVKAESYWVFTFKQNAQFPHNSKQTKIDFSSRPNRGIGCNGTNNRVKAFCSVTGDPTLGRKKRVIC
jgi:hypothetical protein